MTQTDKRFHITVLNDNTVKFVDYMAGNELLTISFKEHSDAVDCQNALQWQCDLMNDLYEDKEYYQTKAGKCEEELLNLRRENKELKKRDDLVSSCLRDEGSITLEKYDEIVDYLYKEWKKKRDLNDRE